MRQKTKMTMVELLFLQVFPITLLKLIADMTLFVCFIMHLCKVIIQRVKSFIFISEPLIKRIQFLFGSFFISSGSSKKITFCSKDTTYAYDRMSRPFQQYFSHGRGITNVLCISKGELHFRRFGFDNQYVFARHFGNTIAQLL